MLLITNKPHDNHQFEVIWYKIHSDRYANLGKLSPATETWASACLVMMVAAHDSDDDA